MKTFDEIKAEFTKATPRIVFVPQVPALKRLLAHHAKKINSTDVCEVLTTLYADYEAQAAAYKLGNEPNLALYINNELLKITK